MVVAEPRSAITQVPFIPARFTGPESVLSPAVYTTREEVGSCRPSPNIGTKVSGVSQEMEHVPQQVGHRRPTSAHY
ncbi:hypothetical protein E2C01_014107 [Portunus trituberculatus]|uniref:Uncharacterized protein n=1 Tax=Portunus trituberculatus TaxID=210409 RepID=A0A5B7DHY5_PORTR|nr:hypothetical protein [Portunus trituberculatus]